MKEGNFMTINDLSLNHIQELTGSISTLTTGKTIDDVYIELDASSQNKLMSILTTSRITRENQMLFCYEISTDKTNDMLLREGQMPLIRTSNGYALTTQTTSPIRFKGSFKTLVPLKKSANTICAIEVLISNLSFDFSRARISCDDDIICYSNVGLTIWSSDCTCRIME